MQKKDAWNHVAARGRPTLSPRTAIDLADVKKEHVSASSLCLNEELTPWEVQSYPRSSHVEAKLAKFLPVTIDCAGGGFFP